MNDKVRLLETSGSLYTYYYTLGDTVDYYYGNLLPSTGYIKLFDIVKYYDGLLLRIPNKENPDVLEEVVKQEKMLDVFKEYLNWSYIMGLNNAGDFNLACEEGARYGFNQCSGSIAGKENSPDCRYDLPSWGKR